MTPGHVSSTPRLVRSADALVEAGYRVHVVSGVTFGPGVALDQTLLRRAGWDHVAVDARSGLGCSWRRVARRVARRRLATNRPDAVGRAARAHHAEALRLGAVAGRVEADLFVGHCLAGLVAAHRAAAKRKVPYGFDAEDFHETETAEAMADPVEMRARRTLLRALLPGCAHLTAASPAIAEEYARAYAVEPIPVLNAFPRTDAPAVRGPAPSFTAATPARFYWFSQTVGPGRGLEATVDAIARLQTPAELHLRGFVEPAYRASLDALADRRGLRTRIRWLPPAEPDEMVRLAAEADVGLSVERSSPPNRDLCLTNKVFAYMLAGLPQILSTTQAHRRLAPDLGPAALLVDLDDPSAAAQSIDALLEDRGRFAAAREAAWQLARARYCWDVEKAKVLESIASVFRVRVPT